MTEKISDGIRTFFKKITGKVCERRSAWATLTCVSVIRTSPLRTRTEKFLSNHIYDHLRHAFRYCSEPHYWHFISSPFMPSKGLPINTLSRLFMPRYTCHLLITFRRGVQWHRWYIIANSLPWFFVYLGLDLIVFILYCLTERNKIPARLVWKSCSQFRAKVGNSMIRTAWSLICR